MAAPSAVAPSTPSANSQKAHPTLSERFKDKLSRFRHKEPSANGMQSGEPPSPVVSLGTPESPSHFLGTAQPPNSASSSAATSPLPGSSGRPSTPSLLSSLPAPTLGQSAFGAALSLPPAGGSGSKRAIKRSQSSSPAVSPSLSPMPSASSLNAIPPAPLNGSSNTGSLTLSQSPSLPALSSLALPPSIPLPLLSSFSRPELGSLYIRVVEGRNLGPVSSKSLRTHLLVYFEQPAPTRSASFTGVNPFYGHNTQCEVTDVTHDVVIVVVEEHQLRKDSAVGQLIVPLSALLATDLHPKRRHFAMDEWIELYPAAYDEGPNGLFYHKWPSNEHRITGAGMRKPSRWPIGQLHVKLELSLDRSVGSCYIISQAFGTRKPAEQKKGGKDDKQHNRDATVITSTTLAPASHASAEQGGDILEPVTPVTNDGSLVVRSVAPEFHGPTFKRNFRRLERLYREPAHWLHYARLCQQWEYPLLSIFALLILYALCFNTRPHHVPLLVFAGLFLVGLASAFRSHEGESDIITFDTEAIPSEWLKEGYIHKFRRWRGVLGRASFVLGQLASRLEQLSGAFNWSDQHLSTLVYALTGSMLTAMSLLFYFVPVGVVTMVLGCGWMLDGLLAALKRWETDYYTLVKMQRALAELEAMSHKNGRRKLITDTTPLPAPTAAERVSSTAPTAEGTTAVAEAGSGRKDREESKRDAEASLGTTPPAKRNFFALRRRFKGSGGKKLESEQSIVTSFDDQQLPSSAEPSTTPSGRQRTASVDSAPDLNSRASTPDSSVSLSPSLSPSSQTRLPQAGLLHASMSWPVSLAETRLAGEHTNGVETNGAYRTGPPLPPRLLTRLLRLCPSLATLQSYLLTMQALLPLFLDVARLLSLYFRMACRHLASRAPDSLEIAHRVIATRAMKDHSVTDSERVVRRRSTHREAVRARKKAQDAAKAAAMAGVRQSGATTHHNALAHQLTQVYQSIHRARINSGAVPTAVTVTSPQHGLGSGSGGPPLSRAAPSAVAAGMAGEAGSRVLSVDSHFLSAHADHSPLSPSSAGSSAQWESDSDDDDGMSDSGGSSDEDD